MNHLRPRNDYAEEKVRVFCPPIREKNLLEKIAGHAKHDGTNIWCSINTLMHEAGLSRATVHRQLKRLVELKLLNIIPGGHGARDTNHYEVPMAALALDELEILTGVTGRQLVLPIAHDEGRSDVTVGELWQPIAVEAKSLLDRKFTGATEEQENHWRKELESQGETLKGLTMQRKGLTVIPKPINNQSSQPGLGLILKENAEQGVTASYADGRDEDRGIGGPIAEEIAATLRALVNKVDAPPARRHLRESEQIQEARRAIAIERGQVARAGQAAFGSLLENINWPETLLGPGKTEDGTK